MFKSHVINCPLASNVLRFHAIVASHSMPWPEQVLKLRYETWFSLMSKVCQFPLAGMLGPGQPSSFSSPQFVKIATSALHWLPVSLVDQTMPQHRPPSGAKLASINIMQWDVAAGSVLKAFAIMLSSWQIVMVVIVRCAFNECVCVAGLAVLVLVELQCSQHMSLVVGHVRVGGSIHCCHGSQASYGEHHR